MPSTPYHKIPGPFRRDPGTNRLTREWSSPELEALADLPIWNATEKIDGTNIRVHWDGYRVAFAGRTDNAEIPKPLLAHLEEKFGGEDRETLFEQKFGANPVTLYGEGFGPKIQNGGKYGDTVQFALFDVRIDDLWLKLDAVRDIAAYFSVDSAPLYAEGWSLSELVEEVAAGAAQSEYGDFYAEGLVATTSLGLLDRRGERLVVKLKHRDLFEGGAQ